MKRVVPMIAGAGVLALANVALAEEADLASSDGPILLTDLQMDGVTAGQTASVSAFASGNVLVNGDFTLDVFPGVFSTASIFANAVPFATDAFVAVSAAVTGP